MLSIIFTLILFLILCYGVYFFVNFIFSKLGVEGFPANIIWALLGLCALIVFVGIVYPAAGIPSYRVPA